MDNEDYEQNDDNEVEGRREEEIVWTYCALISSRSVFEKNDEIRGECSMSEEGIFRKTSCDKVIVGIEEDEDEEEALINFF
jgi:hypothetical protein